MQKIKTYLRDHGHAPFKFGEGRISGYICAALGLLSLLAVLCFLLPEWLTTTELRKVYNEQLARSLLLLGLALLISAAVFIPLEKLYAKNAVPWLWRFHAVHHSSTAMDWLTGSRVHFVEVLLTCTAVLMPLMLLGFSAQALNAYVVLVGVQAVLAHANVCIKGGWLEYVLVLPRYHHWHHARHPDYLYKNYAIHLPLIDRVFGAFKLPAKDWPTRYGVFGEPLPDGILRQHLYPFQKRVQTRGKHEGVTQPAGVSEGAE
ncbi:sterol desaturase family protein [Pseudomonas veronii]|uniref:sterol desaturase family protein n=1 Tax=Pseudomonas veronii TaxID=76761 RepID=UPI00265A5A42|nr:sterol desaturase family protein [Pseudomonas veronii]WKC46913.1 sterol desaturase family protein [Pseudomonas veronii]